MTKVKVVEVVGQKLDPKAKYIITIHPLHYGSLWKPLQKELLRLIGPNFTLLPIERDMLHVYEVMPKTKKEAK